jgi:hypothetical protein
LIAPWRIRDKFHSLSEDFIIGGVTSILEFIARTKLLDRRLRGPAHRNDTPSPCRLCSGASGAL